ncbi:haloacid dehalogenase-like hydrolase [Kitasatospora sp. CM 4170]|uniref:HAD family hydrolase n=1 Tax=Kitasatospora aburaviensis TaxID=67265 RepID=A0ABW1EZA4_9ACTN|nr:haloacid dehalogenase-like hydrolase [Kitasatospora sp. CM 4170]WNM43476.1 haloacid dehalogenase-like hydrolase [Kitasatospora sp. CM 4170]
MKRLLLLWDIDGTLIDDGHIGEAVYPLAFERLTGRSALHRVITAGRTEPDVMDELFRRHGVSGVEPSRVAAELATQLRRRTAELRTVGRPLPGAVEALRALGAQRHVVQSVLTGNLRANALLKLRLFGLAQFLDLAVGAYGGDARERAALVQVARRRAAAAYGRAFDADGTVLIGDTPRDVQAGRTGGARVIAVASGASSAAALREAGADAVLAALRDTEAVVRAVQALAPGVRSSG